MNTALVRPPAASGPRATRSDAGHDASAAASEHRAFGEMFGELIPLVDAVAGYHAARLIPVESRRVVA